jgi:hypothetical protein
LIFSAPTAFGQSITATKAYVDRKYAEATNAVPSIVTNEIRLVSSNAVNEAGWVYTWGEWEIVEARLLSDGKPFEGVTIVPYLEGWMPSVGGMTFDTVQGTKDSTDITWYEAGAYVINAQRRRVWECRRNALGLAMAKDVPTAETITNVARSVVNSVWDAALGVAWEARMHNGHLYYIAVTNKPPEVK